MSASGVVRRVAAAGLQPLRPEDFRADLLAQIEAGMRVVSLFGRREGADVIATAVLSPPNGTLRLSRCRVAAATGWHELTSAHPPLHVFERELHEQTGLRVAGHKWPKPIRYEGGTQAAMNDHPWYRIGGKEVHEVAVGPVHAGVIEPGSFRFLCHGEQVLHLEIHLGYQHRGVEARLLQGDPRRKTPLVETIAGDTSVAHAWAHAAALEALCDVSIDPRAERLRALALELERVGLHLATLAGLAADIGFLQGATTYGRLRTTAINAMMRLCGSRFGRGAIRPGGVGLVLDEPRITALREALTLLQRDLAIVDELYQGSETVRHRFEHVGTLTREQALELGVVGLVARASGVALDLRQGRRDGLYAEAPLEAAPLGAGDCLARSELRLEELRRSLAWLQRQLDRDDARPAERRALGPLAPGQLVISLVEGTRGEVMHALETDVNGKLCHHKVQDPSLRNWHGLALAVRDNEISDFPICNKSFDLSYCGNDL